MSKLDRLGHGRSHASASSFRCASRTRLTRARRARAFAASGLVVLGCWLPGCGDPPRERSRAQPSASASPENEAPPPWAVEVGKSLASGGQLGAARRVEQASVPDRAYETNEAVAVRRLVYRVSLLVPAGLRAQHPPLLPSSGELHVDVGLERLRARFVGQGWPVDDGSEVRLRSDVPGAYLIDGSGGRPIAAGQLAGWFQGEEAERRRQQLWVRPEAPPTLPGPAELVCALLAEWTDQPRGELIPRCAEGALPQAFGFGLWTGELTAIVPMTMLRAQLRADAVDLPRSITTSPIRGLLDPRDAGRLEATVLPPPKGKARSDAPPARSEPPPRAAADASLRVTNPTSARALVVVQGVPVAWLKPGARGEFKGFVPGRYRVGAARPFGQSAMTPLQVSIPGEVTLGHGARTAAPEPQALDADRTGSNQLASPPTSVSPAAAR